MRKYLYVATIAASALVLAAPAAQAHTAQAHAAPAHAVHVLTIGKARGKAVAPKAKLKANVAKGTSATFSLSGQKITCHIFKFTKRVIVNPVRPGTATLSNTALTVGKCTTSVKGAKISITAQDLPYNVSASDAKGDPVTVSGRSSSSPIELTAKVSLGVQSITCSYSAPSISGHFSNKTHLVTFAKQPFTAVTGGNPICPPGPALFSAHLGPIRDVSVTGSPIIYVN